ncbi:MAG: acyl-CoA dehydrogenase family protein, partial [Acidimicrobiia bacterium]|nr:acyl-CoA dehydrogenase family protein [Acidimicrobiia bacterium]
MSDLERVDALIDQLLTENPPATTEVRELWGAQFDLGLAWVWHPEGYGGIGVDRKYQAHVNTRMNEAGASTDNRLFNLLGIAMGAGVLMAHGTEEQKARWLRPMFTGEEIWCQMFSEPGAGSDVAGLST